MAKQVPKLNSRQRRIDLDLDNESNMLFVSNGSSRRSIRCDTNGLTEASESERLIAVALDQDDGVIVRVVYGSLNKQEGEEWIERGTRVLDLRDGQLVVSGGNTFVSDKQSEEDLKDEVMFYQPIAVRPNRYAVTVFTHAPSANGFRLTRQAGWKGFLDYAKQSRPRKKYPLWLIEYANLEGEEIESIAPNQIEQQPETLIQFVVQLEKLDESIAMSGLTHGYRLDMESRLPSKCPRGIPATIVKSDDNRR